MIRFACPRCKSVFSAPDRKAGAKTTCPKCQQRMQIPSPPKTKTILAPLVEYQPDSDAAQPKRPASQADPDWHSAPPPVRSVGNSVADADADAAPLKVSRNTPRYAANDGTYAGDMPYPPYLPKTTRRWRLWRWIWHPTRIDPPENSGETLIRFFLNLLRLGLVVFVVKWVLIIAFLILCGLFIACAGILGGGKGF